MRRNSITVNESGNIIMPENVSNIWMSEPEFGGTVRSNCSDTSFCHQKHL